MNTEVNQSDCPYIPEGKVLLHVDENHKIMIMAKEYALTHSLDQAMPNASIIIKDGVILGIGANGSLYHKTNPCERKKLGCKTGEGYDLCEGCHPKNHGEAQAILNAKSKGQNLFGADLYMWGHWWCCKSCWDKMIEVGIKNVYIMKGAKEKFDTRK